MNETAWLLQQVRQWEDRTALVWRDQSVSYATLLAAADRWKERLRDLDAKPGTVVMLEGDYSPEAVGLLLAAIAGAHVAVPVSRSAEAHRSEFMDIAEAHVIATFADDDQCHIERRAVESRNALLVALRELGQPGLVIFSSGSTGKPKASLHNLARFLTKFRPPRAPLRAVAVPPMDHVAGLDTLFYSLASGGTLLCPADRGPRAVCQLIERYRAELLPASATFLNLLLISEAYEDCDLSSVRIVAYGSEIMPERTLARLLDIMPNSKFVQKYGTTELGSPRTRSKDGAGSLWFKVDNNGVETKIVDGVLWIRAHSAMMGYLNAPSPFDEEGWLNTQDMVEVDGDYIRILGRRSEIISIGAQKVYPAEVENVLMQMENIRDATVYGEENPITGHIVAVRVNLVAPEDLTALKRRMRAFCRDKLAPYKVPVKIEITGQDQFGSRYKKVRRPAALS